MDTKQTHEWTFARNLVVGDKIKVAGQECTIAKVEDIFHYMPKARVRITLDIDIVETITRNRQMVLFLPEMMTVKRTLN